jgi:hypothetical protein
LLRKFYVRIPLVLGRITQLGGAKQLGKAARSIRGVEIRCTCRLIKDRHANLKSQRVNVTTPSD